MPENLVLDPRQAGGVIEAWNRLLRPEPWLALDLVRRADRGAALLDRERPDWHRYVSIARLDMTSDDDILGQVFGGYHAGCGWLYRRQPVDRPFSASEHGFTLRDDEQQDAAGRIMFRFAALTSLWALRVFRRDHRDAEAGHA